MSDPEAQEKNQSGRFLTLFLPGVVGILSLLLVLAPQVQSALAATPQAPPLAIVLGLSLIQPLLLLTLAVWLGNRLTPSTGLRSLAHEARQAGSSFWAALRPALPRAAVIGLLVGVAILVLDVVISPAVSGSAQSLADMQPRTIAELAVGMLYGGITEELLLRWGMMSLLAWAGWRLLQRGQGTPHPGMIWAAIVFSALLFGIGHLPALAAAVPLTTPLILRTVLLNALGGIAYGWLFWRDGLEAGMLAHAATHVAFALVSWVA